MLAAANWTISRGVRENDLHGSHSHATFKGFTQVRRIHAFTVVYSHQNSSLHTVGSKNMVADYIPQVSVVGKAGRHLSQATETEEVVGWVLVLAHWADRMVPHLCSNGALVSVHAHIWGAMHTQRCATE